MDQEDIRTAALSYLAEKSRSLQAAGDRRRKGLFRITTSNENLITRSDSNEGTVFTLNLTAIRQIVKEDFRVLENGVFSRTGDNGKTHLTVHCELQGRGFKGERMIKLMRNKKQKYGGHNVGINYKPEGGINFEDTWRDWKLQGLINAYGYSGSAVDQLRTTENIFVLIANPAAVCKLKRSLVTHENLIKIHTNTHFVHDGQIFEFPEGIKKPRPPPSMFEADTNANVPSGSRSRNDADIRSVTYSSGTASVSRINPYSNASARKGSSLITTAANGWNGAPSSGKSSGPTRGWNAGVQEYDEFQTF